MAVGARYCPSCGAALGPAAGAGDADATDAAAGASGGSAAAGAAPVAPSAVTPRAGRSTTATDPEPSVTLDGMPVMTRPGRDACPTCGHRNQAGRVLCASCGGALDASQDRHGIAPPPTHHAVGSAVRLVGVPDVTDPPRPVRALLVVVVVLAAAAGLGALAGWLLTRGDVEVVSPTPTPTSAAPVEGPVFDPDAFPADPAPLPVAGIGATGTVDGATAPVAALVDGDLATVWRGLPPADAVGGVTVAVELEGTSWVRRIEFANGPPDATEGTGALQLRLRGDSGVVVVQLLDIPGWQEVVLPEPVLTTGLQLELLSGIDPGQELVLQELAVFGHPAPTATPDDGASVAPDAPGSTPEVTPTPEPAG